MLSNVTFKHSVPYYKGTFEEETYTVPFLNEIGKCTTSRASPWCITTTLDFQGGGLAKQKSAGN